MGKKEKLNGKIQRQQEILNAAKAAHRGLTAEEQTEFDGLQREIEALQREIGTEEGTGRSGEPVGNPNMAENGGTGAQERTAEERIRQERARISEITSLCREFGMDDQLQGYIDGNTSVENVRAAVIERMRKNNAPLAGRVTVESDEQDKFRNAASDALLMRGGVEVRNPAEGARELRGMSLRDLAIECLEAGGITGMHRKSADELFSEMRASDPLRFPGYSEKKAKAEKTSGEKESVITGEAVIDSARCALFAMDPFYMMGSMGSVTGEKITRLFEYAADNSLPVIGFTASGGARMQEGLLSLMQMAKTSAAVKRHSDKGLLYITVLTDPTTGGVTASFAMEGDIIISEPGATIGFAGKRVIEETTGKTLPKGFQTAEFLLEHGFLDIISERKEMKRLLSSLLKMHERKEAL